MKRPLPSSRRTFESSRNITRGTLNLGIGAFSNVFPTLGRFVTKIDGGRPQQEKSDTVSRRTRASVDVGLSRSNSNLSTILNNQNIQNQLLERLLSSLKASNQSAPSPGSNSSLITDILTGLGLLSLIPSIRGLVSPRVALAPKPLAQAAPRPAPKPPAARPLATTATPPAARPPAPTVASRAAAPLRAVAAGARLLARFAGPIGIAYTLYDGLQQLARESSRLPVAPRQRLFRTIQSLESNITDLRNFEQQLRDEENEQKAAELAVDIENILRNIESQRARILQLAADLDRASNSTLYTQTVRRLLGDSSSLSPQETALVAPPPSPAPPPAPTSDPPLPAVPPSVPRVPAPPSAVAIPAPPSVPQVPVPTADSAVTRVEGSSIVYEFEKILFEADLIKFDGPFNLQAQAAAVSLPSVSSGSTPRPTIQPMQTGAGSVSSGGSSGTTTSGGGGTSAAGSSGGSAPVATQVSGASVTSSAPQVTGTTAQILATIRQKESGSNYQAQSRASSASGAYQFIDGTWRSLTRQFNMGTEFNRAVEAPPAVQDAVAAAYVNQILSRNNGNVSAVPLVWYTGNAQGNMSAAALATNRGLTPQEYQRQWMQSFASMGGSIPTNSAQVTSVPPASGPALAQASTARVSIDRQQVTVNQRTVAELERRPPMSQQQQGASATLLQPPGSRTSGGEVSLKTRLLSTFDQLARAS